MIATSYHNVYPLNTASVFLCYYVFTASIMHVISRTFFFHSLASRLLLIIV